MTSTQWVVILHRLATRDRLVLWGITNYSSCVLFHGAVESHDHLFYGCMFAEYV